MTSRSPAVKRLMKEYSELRESPSPEFTAAPMEENMLEWHFTLRGPSIGGFSGGRYHGRLVFPPEYPFKPPDVYFLTQSGRFEINKKICLSLTGYHPEHWRPAWGVSTALIAIISFFPTPGEGAVGALDYSEEERAYLAKESRKYTCSICGSKNSEALPDESIVPSSKLNIVKGIEIGKHSPPPAGQKNDSENLGTTESQGKVEESSSLTESNPLKSDTLKPTLDSRDESASTSKIPENQQDLEYSLALNLLQTLIPPKYFKFYKNKLEQATVTVNGVKKISSSRIQEVKAEIPRLKISPQDLISLNRVKTRLDLILPLTREQSKLYVKELLREKLFLNFSGGDVGDLETEWLKRYSNQEIIHYLELENSFLAISKNLNSEMSHSRTLSSMDLCLLILGLLIFLFALQLAT